MKGVQLVSVSLLVSCVLGSPADLHTVKKRVGNLPVIAGDDDANSLALLKYKKWRLQPVQVKQVESYENKPDKEAKDVENDNDSNTKSGHHTEKKRGSPMQTLTKVHTSSKDFSNVNGNILTSEEQRKQAAENGHLIESLHHTGKMQALNGQEPKEQEMIETDVPSLGIHEKLFSQDGRVVDLSDNSIEKRGDLDPDLVMQMADVLAGYIEQTGDEAGVAEYIQQMIVKGEMDESEALLYLDTIKQVLARDEELEREREIEEETEREREAQLMLNFSDYLDRKYESGEMPRTIYKQLKDKLMESVLEKAELDPKFLVNPDVAGF